MKYNYQDITKLQSEAEVNFEIADKALKKSRGDFNKAMYLAMKQKKKYESRSKTAHQVNDVFDTFFSYRFLAYKKNRTYINIRMWIFILVALFMNAIFDGAIAFFIIPLIITFFFGVEYKIVSITKKSKEPSVNVEPVANTTTKDEDLSLNLSEEVVEDDDEGFAKVEIDK